MSRSMLTCQAEWRVCPQHGNTMTICADKSWCRICGKAWEYDRHLQACQEPAVYRLANVSNCPLLCEGHALAALQEVPGAHLISLDSDHMSTQDRNVGVGR